MVGLSHVTRFERLPYLGGTDGHIFDQQRVKLFDFKTILRPQQSKRLKIAFPVVPEFVIISGYQLVNVHFTYQDLLNKISIRKSRKLFGERIDYQMTKA